MIPKNQSVILASASPRRLEILQNLGFIVQVIAPCIDETPQPNESPEAYVLRMAEEKNQAVQANENQWVIAADTIVIAPDGSILGKPKNKIDAHRMLSLLSGSTHQVFSAVCVRQGFCCKKTICKNQVTFMKLTDDIIEAYIATEEPMDKAGAYGIQGLGGTLISHLSGSFSGVMGLPVFEMMQIFTKFS